MGRSPDGESETLREGRVSSKEGRDGTGSGKGSALPLFPRRLDAPSSVHLTPLRLPDRVPRLMLKRTPFYDFHVAQGARMVEFAGWEMPIVYRSIIDEHEQTRRSGSIFDVSHMGRVHFTGQDAQAFLNKVCTRNFTDQKLGQSRYSLVCNESGGVLDDVIVSRDAKHWLMV